MTSESFHSPRLPVITRIWAEKAANGLAVIHLGDAGDIFLHSVDLARQWQDAGMDAEVFLDPGGPMSRIRDRLDDAGAAPVAVLSVVHDRGVGVCYGCGIAGAGVHECDGQAEWPPEPARDVSARFAPIAAVPDAPTCARCGDSEDVVLHRGQQVCNNAVLCAERAEQQHAGSRM